MLRQRSIRTKLRIALALLSAIVLLLAFSGFWGLYRYQRLADAVSKRAMEIQSSHALMTELRTRQQQTGGMIESSPLDNPLLDLREVERLLFEGALLDFAVDLQRYEDSVAATAEKDSLLIDNARQLRSLGEIRESLSVIEAFRRTPQPIDGSRHAQMTEALKTLVQLTAEHLDLIHNGMAEFSNDVRGQYRAWIAMAWSCTIAAMIIVIILLWSFHWMVVKPFQTLLAGSRLVSQDEQFDHRIDLGTEDELSELAVAMNEMTDRFQGALAKVNLYCQDLDQEVRERTKQVIQNEQLASVGFLAAGVAHEINNPLASIAWSAESLASRVSELSMCGAGDRVVDDELHEALQTNLRRIEDEAYRCKGITEKLLDFSRLSEVRRSSTDISELVQEVVGMVGKVGKYRCKTLRTHIDPDAVAEVNSQEIRQVVLNLVTNALESVETDGAVDVYVSGNDERVVVAVKDNGCGMCQEVLDHLFEPFFTRRRDGTGTGLGLSITYRIVSQHGGSLTANSDGEGCGSRMEMMLPVTPAQEDSIDTGLDSLRLNAKEDLENDRKAA